MQRENSFDVAVVGGGPAGMMSAIQAAKSGAKVILIEKNHQLGKKLLLSGGGRCNITNAEFNLRKLVENYGDGGKFLFHAFFVFGPKQVIKFFEDIGIKTKIEKGNRVFPVSEKAMDVLSALRLYLLKNKVNISLNSTVSRVVIHGNKIEKLVVGQKEIFASKYILCTGGKSYPVTGSTGEGLTWAKDWGHNIADLSAALVPVKIKEYWIKKLQGLVVNNAQITLFKNNKKMAYERGDILFTHFGLSGPAILNLSKKIGKLLKSGEVKIKLDVFPDITAEALEKNISQKIINNPKKNTKVFLADFVPQRFAMAILGNLNINGEKQANNITATERRTLAKYLKGVEVTAIELLGFDLAMVTSGGILLTEIDDKTMKSKIISNLFFAGEIIDIDGKTGGFNLQECWSTGYLAGLSATK